ncbi:MAG: FAD-binding oxidoreductase [Haloferacaceae archaeon]
MEVRPHLSQHETAKRLPLITESAVVTEVEAMDRSRNDAVVRAIRRTLDRSDGVAWRRIRPESDGACRRWIRERLERVGPGDRHAPLNRYLAPGDATGRRASRLVALQERFIRPYPSLIRVTVETDEPVEFVAGQYVSVRYRGTTRPYSVASSPTRDDLEFCIRRVPGGELTSDLAETLSEGDVVTLRGPYGDFVMEPPSKRDLVFLATGTGVAPFRSMIDYCFETGRNVHRGDPRDVWLFLGCAWEDDLPYRERFRALAAEHDRFHFVPTLSREEYLTDWDGETAYVQHALVKYVDPDALADVDLPRAFERYRGEPPAVRTDARIDPGSAEVYACGINAMVYALVAAVERLGVPERHTQFEGFG